MFDMTKEQYVILTFVHDMEMANNKDTVLKCYRQYRVWSYVENLIGFISNDTREKLNEKFKSIMKNRLEELKNDKR